MEELYTRRANARKNWRELHIRIIILNQMCREQRAMIIRANEKLAIENEKKLAMMKKRCDIPVIMPDSYKFMIWDVLKSMLYLTSIYSLTYLAAFSFQNKSNFFGNFDFAVDIVQLMDIGVTFFTAKKHRDVSARTHNFR